MSAATAPTAVAGLSSASAHEDLLGCLERCLEAPKPEQREIVIEYYRDTLRARIERRRALARRLGISANAPGLRAARIRAALEACIAGCCRE